MVRTQISSSSSWTYLCFDNAEDVSNPPMQSILPIWVFQPIFQMELEKLAKTN